MKRQLASCVAILAAAFSASAQNEKSPELQVLDHFVGTWDIEVTVKLAGGEEATRDAVSHRRWSIGGKYLLSDDPGTDGGNERHMALTYDLETKTYPGVQITGPRKGAVTGTWSADTKTMTYLIEYLDGSKYEGTHRFVRPGHADAAGKITGPDGAVIVELSWKHTRRKPLGKAPSVDKLIASYHESIGGLEANKKITTRRREGTFSLFGSPPAKMTVIQKAPDLGLTKIETAGGNALEGHDGKVVWKSNPVEGAVELQGAERVQKLRDYQFHKYLDLKSEFKTLTSKGRETVRGTAYDVLEAVREDGSSETLFFHAWTHHLRLVKLADFTIEMTNYRESGGIFYPATTSVVLPGGRTAMIGKFTKIEHGIKVDDALFRKPKE